MKLEQAPQKLSEHPYAGNPAENYERYFVPVIGAPLAEHLVNDAALRAGERVLDVACGTGVVTRLAAARVGPTGQVAGADGHPGMLAAARAAAALSGHTSIQWYETAAEAMPLPDAAYDVVFCQLGLQFFADRAAALQEMRRVLAPGGRVAINAPARTAFFDVLEQAVTRHVGPAPGGFVGRVFSLGDASELGGLIRDAGFDEVQVRQDVRRFRLPAAADFLWQYVFSTPLAGTVGQVDEAHRAALERDVVAGWAPWAAGDGLEYDHPILTATARK